MTKQQLSSSSAPAAIQLRELAKQIICHHESVVIRLKQIRRGADDCVVEGCLAGEALITAKKRVGHGNYLAWLEKECRGLSHDSASNYIKIALWARKNPLIRESDSIRAALQLCHEEKTGEKQEPKTWPVYFEAVRRFSKFRGYVDSHPVAQWQHEEREILRENVQPIAEALWPEKFPQRPATVDV